MSARLHLGNQRIASIVKGMTEDTDDLGASYRRFFKHMPKSGDVAHLVLKGHLLVEAEINDMLTLYWKNPSALKDARLSFSQRVSLLKALSPADTLDASMWRAIHLLNSLRNAFAHNLESDKAPKLIEQFCSVYTPLWTKKRFGDAKRIGMSVGFLCGQLDDCREQLQEELGQQRK